MGELIDSLLYCFDLLVGVVVLCLRLVGELIDSLLYCFDLHVGVVVMCLRLVDQPIKICFRALALGMKLADFLLQVFLDLMGRFVSLLGPDESPREPCDDRY